LLASALVGLDRLARRSRRVWFAADVVIAKTTATWLNHIKIDPDLDALRDTPRFAVMIAAAEARLAAAQEPESSPGL
jgi:hypothetical protein